MLEGSPVAQERDIKAICISGTPEALHEIQHPGPTVKSEVTNERISTYATIRQLCKCPANYFQPGVCKCIAAVRHGCGCLESLWMTRNGAHELIWGRGPVRVR